VTTKGPARNRVSPHGEIIAVPGRGAWMGNRGRLHEGRGTRDIVRNHQHKTWITCALSFRNRRVAQWEPHRYTPLFFLDEAVALAAGHRPCGECRYRDYQTYRSLWRETHSEATVYANDMDTRLHRERLDKSGHHAQWKDLPDGVFVATEFGPAVVVGDHLTLWNRDNSYRHRLLRPVGGEVAVLTPAATVRILRAGYPVQIDDSAQ
jgi:hypothetical protein